jgi:thiamine-phosphate pyrophosphorylase
MSGLARVAARLGARAAVGKRWPTLLFFTDPVRTPHPERIVAGLPRGSAVVYRAFGAADAAAKGRALARIAHRRGVLIFVGADPALAATIGADGLHLPERMATRKGRNLNFAKRFCLSAATHGEPAIRRARASGVQALVISPIFSSASPSAGAPLGALRFRRLVRLARLPAYALGGIDGSSARALQGSGAVGLAGIEAFDPTPRT